MSPYEEDCTEDQCIYYTTQGATVIAPMAGKTGRVTTPYRRKKMDDLKPCPFCGSPAVIDSSDGVTRFWGLCMNDDCICCGPIRRSEDDALTAWNNRNSLKGSQQELISSGAMEKLWPVGAVYCQMTKYDPHPTALLPGSVWQQRVFSMECPGVVTLTPAPTKAVNGEGEEYTNVEMEEKFVSKFWERVI